MNKEILQKLIEKKIIPQTHIFAYHVPKTVNHHNSEVSINCSKTFAIEIIAILIRTFKITNPEIFRECLKQKLEQEEIEER